jgi:hypothetical protein
MVQAGSPVCGKWADQPDPDGMAEWFPEWVDRLAAVGNAQVPQVAALAWETLMARIIGREVS